MEITKLYTARGRKAGYAANVAGVEIARGTTAAQAKQAARIGLEKRIANADIPEIIEYRSHVAVMFYDARFDQWGYRIIVHPGEALKSGPVYACTTAGMNREDTLRTLRGHLAQCGHETGETESPLLARDEKAQREFRSWAVFQNRYAEARNRGMSDQDAFDWANRNPARRELWQNDEVAA